MLQRAYKSLREQLYRYCESEDSFWTFGWDLWVRDIVTHTDSWALLFSRLPSALVGTFIVHLMSSLIAFGYACVTFVLHSVELCLPRNNTWLRRAERNAERISTLSQFANRGISFFVRTAVTIPHAVGFHVPLEKVETPPDTHDSMNLQEHWWAFYRHARISVIQLAWSGLFFFFMIRYMCIWLSIGPWLRHALELTSLRDTILSQEIHFQGATKGFTAVSMEALYSHIPGVIRSFINPMSVFILICVTFGFRSMMSVVVFLKRQKIKSLLMPISVVFSICLALGLRFALWSVVNAPIEPVSLP